MHATRRQLHFALTLAWLLASVDAACGWEFRGTRLRGRIDNPNPSSPWSYGDGTGDYGFGEYGELAPPISDAPAPEVSASPSGDLPTFETSGGNSGSSRSGSPGSGGVFDYGEASVTFFAGTSYVDRSSIPITHEDLSSLQTIRWNTLDLNQRYFWQSARIINSIEFVPDGTRPDEPPMAIFALDYGLRYSGRPTFAYLDASGDIFGELSVRTDASNRASGPLAGVRWSARRGDWRINVGAWGMMGYRETDATQLGRVGELLTPGGINRPIWYQPSYFAYQKKYEALAPLGELSARVNYDFSVRTTAFATGSLLYQANLLNAEDMVAYRLPEMGLVEGPSSSLQFWNALVGIEVRR